MTAGQRPEKPATPSDAVKAVQDALVKTHAALDATREALALLVQVTHPQPRNDGSQK